LRVIFTVLSSTASTALTGSYRKPSGALSAEAFLRENSTSAAVTGSPLLNLVSRSLKV